MSTNQVSFTDVSKVFALRVDNQVQKISALKSVNFEVGQSEIVTLIGPSGCGKTTALRILMGLETTIVVWCSSMPNCCHG
jgi:NitT/TauT family transport system ATP-binding protein